jgi:hypothetical protein
MGRVAEGNDRHVIGILKEWARGMKSAFNSSEPFTAHTITHI